MPVDVKGTFGFAINVAEDGGKHPDAKPLLGFGGAGVLEVVDDDADGTYRAVYTVKFEHAIYVLHVLQKKSKRGIATPGPRGREGQTPAEGGRAAPQGDL